MGQFMKLKKKVTILRIFILLWADMLSTYVMWIMQTYLTDVWKLGVTLAAGIMNVYTGLTKFLPLVLFIFVDAGLGNKWNLLISSTAFSIGLIFLTMSTPPVLHKATGTCKDYEPNCLGHTQKVLFYTALALIGVGLSGHVVSLVAFADSQIEKQPEYKPKKAKPRRSNTLMNKLRQLPEDKMKAISILFKVRERRKQKRVQKRQASRTPIAEVDLSALQFQPLEAMLALLQKERVKLLGAACIILVPVIGLIALPYIQPWSIRFGIPGICTLVATLAFVQGICSGSYKEESKPAGRSPFTNVFRVLLASACKMFVDPKQHTQFYETPETDTPKLSHTRGLLSFLDKAAIRLATEVEEPEKYRWRLCTRTEVEETKIIIRMLPIWITLVLCGVVTSVGNTYFVEQANRMNYNIGPVKLPNSVLLVLYELSKSRIKLIYVLIRRYFRRRGQEKYVPSIGIALATIFSVLCCITASRVETHRIHVIRSHGLLDKQENKIPLTVFLMLPQYFLLAGLDSFYENSVTPFLIDQSPPSLEKYLVYLSPGLSGLGIIGSVLSVYVTGQVSEKGGKRNWFQLTLNQSRLDRYYLVLAVLSAANFFWYVFWALLFPLREPGSNKKKAAGNDEERAGNNDGNEEEAPNPENEHPIENGESVDPGEKYANDLLAAYFPGSNDEKAAENDEEKARNIDGIEEEAPNLPKEKPIGNTEWVGPSLNFLVDVSAANFPGSDKA